MSQKTQKDIQYILLLVIVVIAVCAYRFGYMYYTDLADSTKKESKQIKARMEELNDKIALTPIYEESIISADRAYDDIVAKYGPGNTPEKSIVFVTELERVAKGTINTASFSDDTPAFISTETSESGKPRAVAYSNSLILNYEVGYDGLKAMMDYINSYPERMNVENFTTTLNQETGRLAGTMTINLYSIVAEGKTYVEPAITDINTGVDNIFGSAE